jgi:hypothetical protein
MEPFRWWNWKLTPLHPLLFFCFFFMFNFSLFSFSYLVCKRPHSPSLVSHNDSFDSFKEDVWDDYAYQRGTFVAKLETIWLAETTVSFKDESRTALTLFSRKDMFIDYELWNFSNLGEKLDLFDSSTILIHIHTISVGI